MNRNCKILMISVMGAWKKESNSCLWRLCSLSSSPIYYEKNQFNKYFKGEIIYEDIFLCQIFLTYDNVYRNQNL